MWDRQSPGFHGAPGTALSTFLTPKLCQYNQVVVSPAWGLHPAAQLRTYTPLTPASTPSFPHSPPHLASAHRPAGCIPAAGSSPILHPKQPYRAFRRTT